jgi:hypothetical protein
MYEECVAFRIARSLPEPPEHEVVNPEQPIPVMLTMVHDGEEWDLPAVAEAWTASQLVRIHGVHPRNGQTYTHWVPSSAIRMAVDRQTPGTRAARADGLS